MNVLNLTYANMVNMAQKELKKIWIPNVGDFVIDELGMIGVLTNCDKQEVQVTELDGSIRKVYIGVTLLHNGKTWNSENPIWMPRLDQVITFFGNIPNARDFTEQFNRWIFSEASSYAFSSDFLETVELAFAMFMDKVHHKRWNFVAKAWEAVS